jgi:uncharacterized delta-60 repeat protein
LAPGDSARVLAVQPDGKAIVGGTFVVPGVSTNRLLRLERNGTVDPTYVSALLPEERVSRAVLLEDGRLVASVYKSPVDYDYAVSSPRLVRLNTNGALEAGFNLQTESPGLSYNGGILGILLQPDGKIIVHGIFLKIGGVGRGKIARVLPDGSVDPCFDVPFAGEWTPFAAAAAPDGSILVGGSFRQLGGIPSMNLARLIPQPCANGIISMAVPALRWRVDAGPALVPIVRQGGLDLEQTVSFSTSDGSGQNGTITFGVGQRSQVISLALGIGTHEVTLTEASGGASLGTQTRTVVTVNPSAGAGTSGSPDTNYIVRLDGPVSSIDVLPDGRAYISGYFTNVNGDLCPGLARLQADGNRDNH